MVPTQEIFSIYKSNPPREVGTFNEFYALRNDVEHAHNKLAVIESNPAFDIVYAYLENFCAHLRNLMKHQAMVWYRKF